MQGWTRGRQVRAILWSETVAVLPRRAAMMGMVGMKLTLLAVNYIPLNPTIPTSHHIMLQFLLPRIQRFMKACKSLLETYLPLQLPK